MASLYLRIRRSDAQAQHYLLEKQEVVLGRDQGCDVVVPCIHVSRRHARIIRVDDRFYVEDMGTPCGTRIHSQGVGNRLRGRTLLQDQDEIWFADYVVVQFWE